VIPERNASFIAVKDVCDYKQPAPTNFLLHSSPTSLFTAFKSCSSIYFQHPVSPTTGTRDANRFLCFIKQLLHLFIASSQLQPASCTRSPSPTSLFPLTKHPLFLLVLCHNAYSGASTTFFYKMNLQADDFPTLTTNSPTTSLAYQSSKHRKSYFGNLTKQATD